MALFGNKTSANQQQTLTKRQQYERKFATGRSNLLLVIFFTLINTVLCLTKSATYFLFSAYVPYTLTYEAMWWGGKMSAEDYYNMFGVTKDEMQLLFYPQSVFNIMVALAAIIIIAYLLCWIFSKKRPGWLIFALALFAIDTIVMVLMSLFYYVFDTGMILDWVFHVWVLVYLFSGIIAARKLRKLPKEEPITEEIATEYATAIECDIENEVNE